MYRELHLLFLRARQFRPDEASLLMAKHFKAKRDLFGDDLLIHRITWDDVSFPLAAVDTSAEGQLTYRAFFFGRNLSCRRRSKPLTDLDFVGIFPSVTKKGEVSVCFEFLARTSAENCSPLLDILGMSVRQARTIR